jgi:hypothetical protein
VYEPETGTRRLRCDFPEPETKRPEKEERTLKCVDFVWQSPDETWLVEIKDPERPEEPYRTQAVSEAAATLLSGRLVDEHFLPKLFGTYVWLRRKGLLRAVSHRYAVLIATPLDAPLRNSVMDRVQREIDGVGPFDRERGIAPVAEVHDLASWNALSGTPKISRET